jgi:endonuclease III
MSTGDAPGRLECLLDEHAKRIAASSGEDHWQWMDRRPISRKDANKFLLLSMIDFWWKSETAHRRAREFAEVELADPDELWQAVARIPIETWRARTGDRSLHSTARRHLKVREIAEKLLSEYDGDARKLWADRSAQQTLTRLEDLGLGPQLSRMTVGALLDEEEIDGTGDVKADVHLKRVLGRALAGREFTEDEVLAATRAMRPSDPWSLDWPSWHIGRNWCHRTAPLCEQCPLSSECRFRLAHGGIPTISAEA